jgi:hypothetical protein
MNGGNAAVAIDAFEKMALPLGGYERILSL